MMWTFVLSSDRKITMEEMEMIIENFPDHLSSSVFSGREYHKHGSGPDIMGFLSGSNKSMMDNLDDNDIVKKQYREFSVPKMDLGRPMTVDIFYPENNTLCIAGEFPYLSKAQETAEYLKERLEENGHKITINWY